MKKLLVLITGCFLLMFATSSVKAGDTSAGAQAGSKSWAGLNFSQIIEGGEASDEITYRSYIQAHPNVEQMIPPRAMHVKGMEIWREELEIPCQKLIRSMDKLEKLMEKSGDIFQPESLHPMCLPANQDPIKPLANLPKGKNDKNLWSFSYDTGKNCYLKTAIIRALSIAKDNTMTRRALIRFRPMLNPANAGNAFGKSAGASLIEGTTALAFAPGAQFGKSESIVYIRWKIFIDCYNDGPVLPEAKPKNKGPFTIFFNGNGLDSNAIQKNIEWLGKKWPVVRDKRVEFIAFGLPESNPVATERLARQAMIKIGAALANNGISEKELENTFSYNSDAIKKQASITSLQKRNLTGFIKINIINK